MPDIMRVLLTVRPRCPAAFHSALGSCDAGSSPSWASAVRGLSLVWVLGVVSGALLWSAHGLSACRFPARVCPGQMLGHWLPFPLARQLFFHEALSVLDTFLPHFHCNSCLSLWFIFCHLFQPTFWCFLSDLNFPMGIPKSFILILCFLFMMSIMKPLDLSLQLDLLVFE